MNLLLIRLSSFGDILFTTPVIEAVAQEHPGARIDVVSYDRFASALAHHPLVNRLLTLPKRSLSNAARSLKLHHATKQLARFASELRAVKYDCVVDLHNVTDSALIANLARAKHRVGNRRQALGWRFDTRCDFDDRNETACEHAATSNLRYLVEAGLLGPGVLSRQPRLSFYAPPTAKQGVDRYLNDNALTSRELIGLNPGGSYDYKRWPAERFAEVGARLQRQRPGAAILLFGGPAEREAVRKVCNGIPGPVFDTSEFSLYEAFELISRLDLFVTNDSAPLHIAAAAGTPTVGLYGPANFEKFYPLSDAIWPVKIDVPCRPCTPTQGRACSHRSCFLNLSTDQVNAACDQAIAASAARKAS